MLFSKKVRTMGEKTSSYSENSLWDRLFGKRKSQKLEKRRLAVDPLEERVLLSLTVGTQDGYVLNTTAEDILVNTKWQDIRGDVDVATNDSGDVIVAWAAADKLTNGEEDLNIYARYLTDEVVLLTLPEGLAPTGSQNYGGNFELVYNGAEVQRLSFYSALNPTTGSLENVQGTIQIGNYFEGSRRWVSYSYDSTLTPDANAANLQTAIRSIGKDYQNTTVTAYSENEFDITYYGFEGNNVYELGVKECNFTSGYKAGAVASTLSEAETVTLYSTNKVAIGISVYADAWQTARKIEEAFALITNDGLSAPTSREWSYVDQTKTYEYSSSDSPNTISNKVEVSVKPLTYTDATGKTVASKTQFYITFTGNSGLIDQQDLLVKSAKTRDGSQLIYNYSYNNPDGDPLVKTVKQSSPVFRVNSVENPEYLIESYDDAGNPVYALDENGQKIVVGSGKTDQYSPAVAIDSDGNFVIVWESETLQGDTEINARRFAVQGVVDEALYGNIVGYYTDGGISLGTTTATYVPQSADDTYLVKDSTVQQVQGVRPLAEEFVVNVSSNGDQVNPDVACDGHGNFVVTWTTEAQWNSYYAGIYARWFDNSGLALTGEIGVATGQTGTPYYGESSVAMNEDGYSVILYTYGAEASTSNLYFSVYGKISSTAEANLNWYRPISNRQLAARGYTASVDFDNNGRYIIAFTLANSTVNNYPIANAAKSNYSNVYYVALGIKYDEELGYITVDWNGNAVEDLADILDPDNLTQVNGKNVKASTYNDLTTFDQGNVSVGVDADGDIFFSYQGYGDDVQLYARLYSNGSEYHMAPTSTIANLSLTDFFNNNLVYFYRQTLYGSVYSYENKNEDLLGTTSYLDSLVKSGQTNYEDPELYKDGILYKALEYANSYYSKMDVDTYIKACLVGAQINFKDITQDQLGRLTSILEYYLGNLRGAANDILYSSWSSSNGIAPDSGVSTGTVNNYRDGSNARYYLFVPQNNIDDGTVSLDVQVGVNIRSNNGRGFEIGSIEADLSVSNNYLQSAQTAQAIQTALQSALAGYYSDDNESLNDLSVSVRIVSSSELTDWQGTDYAISTSTSTYASNYTVFEILFQNSLHDVPVSLGLNSSSTLTFEDVDGDFKYLYNLTCQSRGDYGTEQSNPAVAMSDSGDVTVVWTHNSDNYYGDTYVAVGTSKNIKSTQIYMRHIVESTDTAGPIVTSVQLPDGTVIENGDSVTSSVKNLVVTFSDDLYTQLAAQSATNYKDRTTQALHSVDNLDNWKILCDGVEITDNIESIIFGLNASSTLAQKSMNSAINTGTLALGTNSYEAVITLKDGSELTTGNYELVISNKVWDTGNNALGSNGTHDVGEDFTLDFSIITLDKTLAFDTVTDPYFSWSVDEKAVEYEDNGALITGIAEADNNITLESILNGDQSSLSSPNSPDAVSSDANGNFVAVWEVDGVGIYYHTYSQRYAFDSTGDRVLVTETIATGLVNGSNTRDANGNITAQQASVALDDRGYFVVSWDMVGQTTGSREVYAARYKLSGELSTLNGAQSYAIVNIETDRDQQNSSVAIDSDGDFVIVWESFDQDATNTWGIYGRRFSPDGYSFGKSNTQQKITIGGNVTNKSYYYVVTYAYTDRNGNRQTINSDKIELSSTTASNRTNLEYALLNMTYAGKTTAQLPEGVNDPSAKVFTTNDIAVTKSGEGSLLVEFKGVFANQTVELLQTKVFDLKTNSSTGAVSVDVASVSEGTLGSEFLVNDTVANHQRYASVDMDAEGNFVVSWTAFGQDGDESYETNIYAKKFVSNHYLRADSSIVAVNVTGALGNAFITSHDDISNHLETSSAYEGVCSISTSDAIGSGVLLNSGLHILTAAHVVCEGNSSVPISVTDLTVEFYTSGGVFTYSGANGDIAAVYVVDGWDGYVQDGNDLAIIQLSVAASTAVKSYDIYRDSDELSQTFYRVGSGLFGNAIDDETVRKDWVTGYENQTKYGGNNTWDVTGSVVLTTGTSGMLIYDLDDGTNANDYLGNNYGVRNTGVSGESGACPGDSGGPCFINGKIAGITSGGFSSSDYGMRYGEFGYDTRVSYYVDWIDSITSGNIGNEFLVNTNLSVDQYYAAVAAGTSFTVDDNMKGYQTWSDVAMDYNGNFVITWTSYAQDGHGDANTGSTTNGLGGIYARRFAYKFDSSYTPTTVTSTTTSAATNDYATTSPFLVCNYTDNDQIHSKVACSWNGDFTITWESYKDREDAGSDLPTSFGIYAKRYLNTEEYFTRLKQHNATRTNQTDTTYSWDSLEGMSNFYIAGLGTFGIYGEYGSEFLVNQTLKGDQLGSAVALNSNGDMIFVWTDKGTQVSTAAGVPVSGSQVKYRTVTLGTDTTPPTVTSADAYYTIWDYIIDNEETNEGHWEQSKVGDDPETWKISLLDNNHTFEYGTSFDNLIFTFSEVMMTSYLSSDLTGIDKADFIAGIGTKYDTPEEAEKAYHEAILKALNEDHNTENGFDNSLSRSILNVGNWTLMRNGTACFTSLVDDLYYTFNDDTGEYELNIQFLKDAGGKSILAKGDYVLTLSDAVTDLFKNKLDGDYDGNAGGSFSLRFSVEGTTSKDNLSDDVPDEPVFTNLTYGHDNSDVVTYTLSDGTQVFIVVATAERVIAYDEDVLAQFPQATIVNVDIDGVSTPYVLLSSICFRKYIETSDGYVLADSSEIIVDTVSDIGQTNPTVAAEISLNQHSGDYEGTDNYVVAWTGIGKTSAQGVYARSCIDGSWGEPQMINSGYRACYDVRTVVVDGYVLFVWREASSDPANPGVKLMGRWVNFTKDLTYMDINSKPFTLCDEGGISVEYFDLATDGEGKVVVTWSCVNKNTGSSEIYAKAFTKSGDSSYTTLTNRFTVNTITKNVQDMPSVSIDAHGNYYIVWESSSTGYYNIYGRAFTLTSSGESVSKSWLGSTSDVKINVSNSTANIEPDVSVSAGGENVVVVWTAHNQEGTNYSTYYRENLQDNGILARVFNGATGTANNNVVSYSVNGEFLVNTTTNGNQVRPAVSATGLREAGTYPFVITWTTPNILWANVTDEPDSSLYGVTITVKEEDYDLLPGFNEVYYKYFPTSMMGAGSIGVVPVVSSATSSSLRFSLNGKTEIGALTGYFQPILAEPIRVVSAAASAGQQGGQNQSIQTSLELSGYKFEMTASGSGWSVKVDGKTINVSSTVTSITFTRVASTASDSSVVIRGKSSDEQLKIDSARKSVSFTSGNMTVQIANAGNFQFSGNGGNDTVTLIANAKDTINLGDEVLALLGLSGISASISDFDSALVIASSKNTTVNLSSSKEKDYYTVNKDNATAVIGSTKYDISGSATLNINGDANDSINVAEVKSLFMVPSVAIASTEKLDALVKGFNTMTFTAASTGQATVTGSRGTDALYGNASNLFFAYGIGPSVRLNNFGSTIINGNGGNDTASLTALKSVTENTFTGYERSAVLSSGRFSTVMNNFSKVTVDASTISNTDKSKATAVLYDTVFDDFISADENILTMKTGSKDLYTLLAFDQVTAKKKEASGNDTYSKTNAVDYLVTEGWNELFEEND